MLRDLHSVGAFDGLQVDPIWVHIDTGYSHHYRVHLHGSPSIAALSLSRKSTGGDSELGRALVRRHRYILRPLLMLAKIVILVAGIGGGTGSGMTPYIARLAREGGALSIAAVCRPFDFEGARVLQADATIKELKRCVELLFAFSNQDLQLAMGDNVLMTVLYEEQAKQIACRLRKTLRRQVLPLLRRTRQAVRTPT